MRKYLLVDIRGRSRRGFSLDLTRATSRRPLSSKIISQNIWECADSPLLAVMINPLHAECVRPRLFELCGDFGDEPVVIRRMGEIDTPVVSAEQKLAFAMYCVRTLSTEHVFSAWVERWLANIDRSVVGAKLMRRELESRAQEADRSCSSVSGFWVNAKKLRGLYEKETEFLRRARDVVNAAITLIEKPRQWHVTLAELVATATSNLLDEASRCKYADLAVCVIPADSEKRQMAEPKRLLRRRDDAPVQLASTMAYAGIGSGELRITGRRRDEKIR